MPSTRTIRLLLGLGILWSIATAAAGPLPGDVALTLVLQSIAEPSAPWARVLTETGKLPALAGLAAMCALLAAWLSGGRAVIALVAALGASKLLELALRAVLHVPRPPSELVQVVAASTSSGFPSTFALVYGATVGLVLFAALASRRPGAPAVATAAFGLLTAGVVARILPGGHWPSQMFASLLLSLGLSALLLRLALSTEPGRAQRKG